jgi:hypothetical protein
MTTINSEQFAELCNAVWRDRATVLSGRGTLSGEATLVRAVFWRLCKAGIKTKGCADNDASRPEILAYQFVVGRMLEANSRPAFDSAPILKELLDRYQGEVRNSFQRDWEEYRYYQASVLSSSKAEMNIKKLLVDFVTVFAVSLVVFVVVTLLWNLIVHRAGTIDWEASSRFAILFGIILPWTESRRSEEK